MIDTTDRGPWPYGRIEELRLRAEKAERERDHAVLAIRKLLLAADNYWTEGKSDPRDWATALTECYAIFDRHSNSLVIKT